jgi:squalene-hopene/tetraprenyl-beta-curcumene cyclase
VDFSLRFRRALEIARQELLAARTPGGHWAGELSSSALSTATAVSALSIVERHDPSLRTPHSALRISNGLDWLARHANTDGGWGDTTLSLSNISTTTLCWAAFGAVPGADEKYRAVVKSAEQWLACEAGGTEAEKLAPAIVRRYGKDRTFSVPILTTCALSGRLGSGASAWDRVLALPFELAAFPHQFFAALRLPVVSYALPALIAIGHARHHHLPSRNPFARWARNLTRERTLKILTGIQPASGGFLEATPLTSFVVMSLAGSGQVNHPVTKRGVEFLLASAREDGSWPIDTNLATWVTTLAVNALANDPSFRLPPAERAAIRNWLLQQQYREVHPYTRAASGGWAWTDLPGGVPDADDSAGALLALKRLADSSRRQEEFLQGEKAGVRTGQFVKSKQSAEAGAEESGVRAGVTWLLNLQNSDGGIPTFCRGWTNLPFDRSAPDLTAHTLRAWNSWLPDLPADLQRRLRRPMQRGLRYLAQTQRSDGAWIPLWFGNQHSADESNAVYGTARVLSALTALSRASKSSQTYFAEGDRHTRQFPDGPEAARMIEHGAQWLVAAQRPDGAWGAPGVGPASVEETALAIEALAGLRSSAAITSLAQAAAMKGANWLIDRVENGEWRQPSPIGFYFARLWYHERLYPQIFTVAALSRVAQVLQGRTDLA